MGSGAALGARWQNVLKLKLERASATAVVEYAHIWYESRLVSSVGYQTVVWEVEDLSPGWTNT